jgi:glycyl-tRNA synthetase beta chain
MFGIGQIPTGDRDPFALRRHALGVLRILIEHRLALDLPELIATAHSHFPSGVLASGTAEAYAFMMERLRNHLRERGFAVDEVDAVVSQSPARIDLVVPRLEAVQAFRRLPEADALAAANKRAKNILRKAGVTDVRAAKSGLLVEAAEQALAKAIVELRGKVDAHYDRGEYVECLRTLAGIKPQVDEFFDKVLVNAEDPAVRENRLALLSGLEYLMNRVADISRLAA